MTEGGAGLRMKLVSSCHEQDIRRSIVPMRSYLVYLLTNIQCAVAGSVNVQLRRHLELVMCHRTS